MTNEEAREILNVLKEYERAYQYSKEEVVGALDMAIKAIERHNFEGKTNGDVIKAVFPNQLVIHEDCNGAKCIVKSKEWWNTPYKECEEE